MPKYLVGSGLPPTPLGLSDRDAALVLPLYQAMTNLAQRVSELTGDVQYTSLETQSLDRAVGVRVSQLNKMGVLAAEDLAYGDVLHTRVVGPEVLAYKATHDDVTKPAHGICDTVGGIATGTYFQMLWMNGRTRGIASAVFGQTYYLGVNGAITAALPATDGIIRQIVGVGLAGAGFYANIIPVGQQVARVTQPSAGVLRAHHTSGTTQDYAV